MGVFIDTLDLAARNVGFIFDLVSRHNGHSMCAGGRSFLLGGAHSQNTLVQAGRNLLCINVRPHFKAFREWNGIATGDERRTAPADDDYVRFLVQFKIHISNVDARKFKDHLENGSIILDAIKRSEGYTLGWGAVGRGSIRLLVVWGIRALHAIQVEGRQILTQFNGKVNYLVGQFSLLAKLPFVVGSLFFRCRHVTVDAGKQIKVSIDPLLGFGRHFI